MADQNFICPGTCKDVFATFNNGFGAGFYECSRLLEKMAQKEGIKLSKDFMQRLQSQDLKSCEKFNRSLAKHEI